MEEIALICEDSLEGVLTGVYDAYLLKKKRQLQTHDEIHIIIGEPIIRNFYTEYVACCMEPDKAQKVAKTIVQVCGEELFQYICQALSTHDADKGDAVYHTIVLGIHYKDKRVFERLSDKYVRKLFELSRFAWNEIHHLKGFLHFQELQNQILYARINPKCEVVPFLADHFADRLPNENFIIYDGRHHMFAIHEKYKPWFIVRGQDLQEEKLCFSEVESDYQRLFRHFCQKISIASRENPTLQRNMLPLRFRADMVEFSNI